MPSNRFARMCQMMDLQKIVGQFEQLQTDETHLIYRPCETIATWIERELRPVVERQD